MFPQLYTPCLIVLLLLLLPKPSINKHTRGLINEIQASSFLNSPLKGSSTVDYNSSSWQVLYSPNTPDLGLDSLFLMFSRTLLSPPPSPSLTHFTHGLKTSHVFSSGFHSRLTLGGRKILLTDKGKGEISTFLLVLSVWLSRKEVGMNEITCFGLS